VWGRRCCGIHRNDPDGILSEIAAGTESLLAWKLGPGNQLPGDHEEGKREGKIKAPALQSA